MPYIITTRPRYARAGRNPEPATRRVVATEDDARAIIVDAGGSRAWHDAVRTIGPLPDGTVIEVEYRTWLEALALTNVVLVGQYPSPSEQRLIIDALNR